MAASTTPTSTIGTFLMVKNASNWEKLVDVKSTPALGGDPEMIAVTTLSDTIVKNVPGVQSLDNLQLTANYTSGEYKKLKALEMSAGEYAIWMGYTTQSDGTLNPTGEDGKYSFTANLRVYINAQDVNGAREMTISLIPLSEIKDETA